MTALLSKSEKEALLFVMSGSDASFFVLSTLEYSIENIFCQIL